MVVAISPSSLMNKKFSLKNKMASIATGTIWLMRLHSAARATLACAIAGVAILYGPKYLSDQIKFPAFSYVTVILIMFDTSLGDALHGCWHAFLATAQVVPLAVLVRWLVAPESHGGLPMGAAALAAAAACFVVALPESVHFTAKRIAIGQIVLVCADAAVRRDNSTKGYMHPVHVAASTALGALACVLALLLPFPGLAYNKVQKLCAVYGDNVSARMNVYSRAFNTHDYETKTELILQAKPMAETGNKLLQNINILEEGMKWERPWSRHNLCPGDRLRSLELAIRGIEYSLVSSLASPVQKSDQEQISSVLYSVSTQLHQKIEQAKHFSPFFSTKPPETRQESTEKPSLVSLHHSIDPIHKYEWGCFLLSCIDMLLSNAPNNHISPKTEFISIQKLKSWIFGVARTENLELALKWSLSLGLAVLFGLKLEKDNGLWAGLTLAISYGPGRQAAFTVANTRAQGTAIGSVYGVVCCFLFHHLELRLLAILPWIIFTAFLMHSRMYGTTGGISASIGALLILGRKNYGPPDEFAIARITAVFLGLSCFILVEICVRPTRAATLARRQLYQILESLQDCIKQMGFDSGPQEQAASRFVEMRAKLRETESLVRELKRFMTDADSEPDFWYSPLRTPCYQKVVMSLCNIMNMLRFMIYNLEILSGLPVSRAIRKQFQEQLSTEVEILEENVSSLLKCLEGSSIKSQPDSQVVAEENLKDVEMGKLQNQEKLISVLIDTEDEEAWRSSEDDKQLREMMVPCLGAIDFCISFLRKEIEAAEMCVKEIVRWENHS